MTRAISFKKAIDTCKDDAELLLAVWKNYPAISTAHEIYTDRSSLCDELEARILASQDLESLARRLGIPIPVLRWYSALFYHVNDRRDSAGWIRHHAIGKSATQGIDPRDRATIWKVFGYGGGPLVLDHLIGMAHTAVTGIDQVPGYLPDQAKSRIEQVHAETALTIRPRSSKDKLRLLELNLKGLKERL